MEDFFILNFDMLTSPSIKLNLQDPEQAEICNSWGISWYPNDSQSATFLRDPTAHDAQITINDLAKKNDFRSTTFFCTITDGQHGNTHNDTQPFVRSYAGRDWLFTLTGELDNKYFEILKEDINPSLLPIGASAAELVFCYLLSKLDKFKIYKLVDIDPNILQIWLNVIDIMGGFNMVLTDSNTIVAYHGKKSNKPFYYHRITPPNPRIDYISDNAQLQLSDPRDSYRTILIFSTKVFIQDNWSTLQPGHLLFGSRGEIFLNDFKNIPHANAQQPPIPQQKINNFSSTQAEQAQTRKDSSLDSKNIHANNNKVITTNPRAIVADPEGKLLAYRTFDVTHRTVYSYTNLIEHSTHIFRLQPVDDSIQEVIQSNISISVEGESIQFEDVFGNNSLHYSILTKYKKLVIENISTVKIYESLPDDHSLSKRQTSIPLFWMPWQRQMMMAYLLPEELPESQLLELTEYAMSFVERNDFHLLKTLQDMNQSIYKDYNYAQGTTSLNTTAFECYSTRVGVCQDFANLFICLARLLGIPARYRMGYIYTGAEYNNKVQSDASHAWVELYLPYVGWRGFDPTNGCMAKQDHIRVACGRNYRDATPTSGTIFKGESDETLNIEVKVIEKSH